MSRAKRVYSACYHYLSVLTYLYLLTTAARAVKAQEDNAGKGEREAAAKAASQERLRAAGLLK